MSNQKKTEDCCPLCLVPGTEFFCKDKLRSYFKCNICRLIFVRPHDQLTPADEKDRYDRHINSPDDPNYRQFLSSLFNPMQRFLTPGSKGLDFGSGPGPTLSLMFEEAGHTMTIYDHYYANDSSVFNCRYDFITASEVVEHLFDPKKELERLWKCLKPDGYLGIMTKLAPADEAFVNWYYKNDSTHVCFFSKYTFEWLALQLKAKLIFAEKSVIILQKTIL